MTDATGKQAQVGQASLEIAHLVKQYANADKPVLDDISFDVPHGTVLVVARVLPAPASRRCCAPSPALSRFRAAPISHRTVEVIETG